MAIRKIVSRSIGVDVIAAEDLAANSITAAEITNGAVTQAKLSTGAPYWDASSNVGIGTASISGKLSINGEVYAAAGAASGVAYGFYPKGTYGNTGMFSPAPNTVAFATTGGERVRIDSSGNVGIGTTTARGLLEIVSGSANTNGDSAYALTVVNANRATATSTGIVTIQSNDSMAANLGGSVAFGGRYSTASTAAANWATISGRKENGVSGEVGGYMAFETRNTAGNIAERVRIDSSGRTLIGITASRPNGGVLQVSAQGQTGLVTYTTSTTNNNAAYFENGNGIVGTIATNGSSTSYNTSSDYRLKENWVAVADALTRVNALKPVNFAWITSGERVDGFLAHELAEVVPEAVSGEKDAMRDEEYKVTPAVLDDEGAVVTPAVMGTRSVPDYQGIDQSKLVPLLTAALQEALAKIDDLTSRVSALEAANV